MTVTSYSTDPSVSTPQPFRRYQRVRVKREADNVFGGDVGVVVAVYPGMVRVLLDPDRFSTDFTAHELTAEVSA